MIKLSYVKKAIITAACIALCVALPMAFHAIPNAASIYCPMHIPVLLCGLLCGLAGPVVSSLLTQMPQMAYLPSMLIELAVYGWVSGVIMQLVHTKNKYIDIYCSLIVALFVGRVIAGISKAFIFARGSYSIAVWATSYFITALPGIIIQLILIPMIIVALENAKLISARYSKKEIGQ